MNASLPFKIDGSGLHALVESARRFSGRVPGVAVATAAYRVGMATMRNTPSTPAEQIYSELSVDVTIAVGPRGGRRKNLVPTDAKTYQARKPIPFAAMIVIARMHPNSNYSQRTGNRWPLAKPDTKGSAEFMKWALTKAKRMISARQSSRSFLRSLWLPGLRQLIATGLVSRSAFRGGTARDAGPRGRAPADGGWALVAVSGASATAELANAAGLDGGNAVMSARRNDALWKYVAPVLELAMAREALETMEYISKQEAKAAFGGLKSSGITIDI